MISKIRRALHLASRKIRNRQQASANFRFEFSAENRSESDNGHYNAAIERALASQEGFENFKRDPDYNAILEHASAEDARGYLDVLKARDDGFLERALPGLLVSDSIGNPRRCELPGVAQPLSGTTLRYIKVASDLNLLFGGDIACAAEIGCGYGGQCLVNDTLLGVREATLFDLPIALRLIERYLENFVLRGSYRTSTINQLSSRSYDLVISNYAFSELPRALQTTYIEKVLANAPCGYLTMNSGRGGQFDESFPKLSLAELKELLPPFEIIEERPLTFPHNYIIVWGHKASAQL